MTHRWVYLQIQASPGYYVCRPKCRGSVSQRGGNVRVRTHTLACVRARADVRGCAQPLAEAHKVIRAHYISVVKGSRAQCEHSKTTCHPNTHTHTHIHIFSHDLCRSSEVVSAVTCRFMIIREAIICRITTASTKKRRFCFCPRRSCRFMSVFLTPGVQISE